MTPTEIRVWISSLERLKQRFADAADEYQQRRKNKTLDLLLLHHSNDLPRATIDDCLQYLAKEAGDDFVLKSASAHERDSILECIRCFGPYGESASRFLFFTLKSPSNRGADLDALWSRWERLLRDAGLSLYSSPPCVQKRFFDQIANSRSNFDGSSFIPDDWEENTWIWALFDAAWSMPRESLLRAERRLFTPDRWDIDYDLESVRDWLQVRGHSESTKLTLRDWSEKLPDFYFSKLSDVYNRSVNFIDWLIVQVDTSPQNNGQEATAPSTGATETSSLTVQPALKGAPGRKPDDAITEHALRANELRSLVPQKSWQECSDAVNSEFKLGGVDRYTRETIREAHRLRHGDKAQKKKRD